MDPRVKIILLFTVSILLILIEQPRTLGFIFLLTLLPYAFVPLERERKKVLFLLLVLGIWGTMFSQALFYAQEPRTVLWVLIPPDLPVLGSLTGGLAVYQEGFLYGAVQSLRFSTMISLGLFLCWTTDSRDFMLGLMHWKIPYEIAFMTITALRFLPLLAEETRTVLTAQKLRGFKAVKGVSLRQTIKTCSYLFLPILANCIRRAGRLAVAAESRAFRGEKERSSLRSLRYSWSDRLVLLGLVSVSFLVLSAKLLYGLYYNGFCYFPACRVLYNIAQIWL